jgi:hypothetical protein
MFNSVNITMLIRQNRIDFITKQNGCEFRSQYRRMEINYQGLVTPVNHNSNYAAQIVDRATLFLDYSVISQW